MGRSWEYRAIAHEKEAKMKAAIAVGRQHLWELKDEVEAFMSGTVWLRTCLTFSTKIILLLCQNVLSWLYCSSFVAFSEFANDIQSTGFKFSPVAAALNPVRAEFAKGIYHHSVGCAVLKQPVWCLFVNVIFVPFSTDWPQPW